MGVEEQKEEREVLDSIFPDEITGSVFLCQRTVQSLLISCIDLSESSYRVSITLDAPADAHDAATEPTAILLNVTYPDAYPDVGPHLDITAPPNAQKHPLLDIAEDKAQLLESLETTIEESLGMAMVFTLVSTLKDAAEQIMADRQRQADEVFETQKRKAEEEENRKFFGTKVTREKFIEWQAKFKAEMEEKARVQKELEEAEEKKKGGAKAVARSEEKKMSGRELWEKGLAGNEADDVEGEDLTEGVKELKVGA
jgi:hypothetical protein